MITFTKHCTTRSKQFTHFTKFLKLNTFNMGLKDNILDKLPSINTRRNNYVVH